MKRVITAKGAQRSKASLVRRRVIPSKVALSLGRRRWVALKMNTLSYELCYELGEEKTESEFQKGIEQHHA